MWTKELVLELLSFALLVSMTTTAIWVWRGQPWKARDMERTWELADIIKLLVLWFSGLHSTWSSEYSRRNNELSQYLGHFGYILYYLQQKSSLMIWDTADTQWAQKVPLACWRLSSKRDCGQEVPCLLVTLKSWGSHFSFWPVEWWSWGSRWGP